MDSTTWIWGTISSHALFASHAVGFIASILYALAFNTNLALGASLIVTCHRLTHSVDAESAEWTAEDISG